MTGSMNIYNIDDLFAVGLLALLSLIMAIFFIVDLIKMLRKRHKEQQ